MKKEQAGRLAVTVLSVLPFCLGLWGLWGSARLSFSDAAYKSIQLYLLGGDDIPKNVLTEIARWTAPLVVTSWIITAVRSFRYFLNSRIRYLRGDCIAVYGEKEEQQELLECLGRRGIMGKDRFVPAGRYILLGSEEENAAFCRENKQKLGKRHVYQRCDSTRGKASALEDGKLFSFEENAARRFWKQSGLVQENVGSVTDVKIILIGFGALGQELLYWGLQDNLFHPAQKLEYHIFGDGTRFCAMHPGLREMTDPVFFHTEKWFEDTPLLSQADRILVCGGEKQEAEVRDLLFALPGKEIDVLCSDGLLRDSFEENDRLRLFYWKRESLKPEVILDESMLERAKEINLRYACLYQGAPDTKAEREAQWERLDPFTRYSNISSADYHEIRLQMLTAMGLSEDYGAFTPAQMELLAELEHIRWCRYHWLNNWSYGIPANGKSKDTKKRIHRSLVPYKELPEEEKEKDRENIRILLGCR